MNADLNSNFREVTESELRGVEGGFFAEIVKTLVVETILNSPGAVARMVKNVAGIDLKK